MRALKIMLFLAVPAIFVSCSKDDDEPSIDRDMLLGEWNLTEFSYSGSSSVSYGNETTSLTYTAETSDLNAQVIFEDKSNYSTRGSYRITITSEMDGETFVENYSFSDVSGRGTYRIEGNKMFTTPQGPVQEGEVQPMDASDAIIQELTPNKMVLVLDQTTVTETDEYEIEMTLNMIQVLTR